MISLSYPAAVALHTFFLTKYHLIRVLQFAAIANVPVGGNVRRLLTGEHELQGGFLEPAGPLGAQYGGWDQDTVHSVERQAFEFHSSCKLK